MPSADQPVERPTTLPRGHMALPPEMVDANQRARLIAAITAIVGEKGYRATTVTDVTHAARMSHRDFYARFDDLATCFAAAFDAGAERLRVAVSEADEPSGAFPNRVDGALAAGLDLLASDPSLARLLFAEFLPREQVVVERYRAWGDRLLTLSRAAAAEGPGASALPESVERAVLGGLASVLSEAVLRDPARLPELAPELTAFLTASYGLGASSVAPSPLGRELASPEPLPVGPSPPQPVVPADPLDTEGLREFSRRRFKANQYERLLAAAAQIVTTQGCAAATILAVSGEAGVARPRLRDLFGGREGVLAATFETAADRLLAALDAAHRPQAGFAEQVEASLRAALDLFASDPTLAALLAVDFLPGSEALPDRYYRLLWRLAARLRHAAAERSLPAPSPLLARATVGGLATAVATSVGEGEADRLPDLAEPLAAWVASLHAGLASPA